MFLMLQFCRIFFFFSGPLTIFFFNKGHVILKDIHYLKTHYGFLIPCELSFQRFFKLTQKLLSSLVRAWAQMLRILRFPKLKIDSSSHPSLMTCRGSGKGKEIPLDETTVCPPHWDSHIYQDIKGSKSLGGKKMVLTQYFPNLLNHETSLPTHATPNNIP